MRGVHEPLARELAWRLEQMKALAGVAPVVMADSRFNAAELEAAGYGPVRVLPLLLDFDRIAAAPDAALLRRLDDGKANVLFVGRCVPNKRIEDLLHAFHYFQSFMAPESRLILVGSLAGFERYHAYLRSIACRLGLQDVLFTGAVPQAELNAYYAAAAVFLCMSEHEGFCIPLLESLAHDVPVVAFAAAAVPETLDGAGILFREGAGTKFPR